MTLETQWFFSSCGGILELGRGFLASSCVGPGKPNLPRGVRTRLEGKQRTPLSSQVATRFSWSPLSGLKGVEPPLQFGERTRDCSPGQAGKEGPHLAMTGASHGFPQAAAPMGVFSRGTTRTSGSLSCGAREVRSPCAWRGGAGHHSRVMGNG